MPALRLLFIVLVLLNLLALAANLGWLGSSQPRGEPERITNQLNPERIVLAPDEAAARRADSAPEQPAPPAAAGDATPTEPAAAPEMPAVEVSAAACVAYAELTERQAEALERAALAAPQGLRAQRGVDNRPSGWWVRIPPAANREAAERRVAELRAQGINDYFIIRDAGPNQFAVSLGVFRTESAARQHLAFLQGKRVRGAEVAARNGVIYSVEISGPANAVSALGERLAAEFPAIQRGACTQ